MTADIFEYSLRLINKYNRIASKPRCYGTDELLYTAEVHIIAAVGSRSKTTVTELSEQMGITKGAISQTLKKLEGKGYICRCVSEKRRNEVHITLSEKGQKVYEYHNAMHGNTREIIEKNLDSETEQAVYRLMKVLDDMLDTINDN